MKRISVFLLAFLIKSTGFAQTKPDGPLNVANGRLLTDMIDSSTSMGKNSFSVFSKFGHVGFSGYMQPQFQVATVKGSPNTYQGGDWGPQVDNRFRLRRGRFRMDYTHYTNQMDPSVYFVFQFDGTERGVSIRDLWGRYYENRFKLFHATMGVIARPFGHEVLLSSTYREAPERGRMSQILMGTERDLGVTFTLNDRNKGSKMKWLVLDLGVYNGQGLTGTQEYDSYKDFIFRLSSKKQVLPKLGNMKVSGGISYLHGAVGNQSELYYSMQKQDGVWGMSESSHVDNIGKAAPRRYYGIDAQLIFPNRAGQTEFRAEYITGKQTGTLKSSVTPGSYPITSGVPDALATRNFDGAYFYFLQHLGSWHHQVVLKYDWYDPNINVKGMDIDGSNQLNVADIKYQTLGAGYIYYFNEYFKMLFWYEHPINESTKLKGFEKDQKDGIFTLRAQFTI